MPAKHHPLIPLVLQAAYRLYDCIGVFRALADMADAFALHVIDVPAMTVEPVEEVGRVPVLNNRVAFAFTIVSRVPDDHAFRLVRPRQPVIPGVAHQRRLGKVGPCGCREKTEDDEEMPKSHAEPGLNNVLKLIRHIAVCLLAMQITFDAAHGKGPIWKATGTPLTTDQVRAAMAGNSLLGATRRGTAVKFYFTEDMDAYWVRTSGPAKQEFHLLRGGVLCWRRSEDQFCYRVYVDGEDYVFAFPNLSISHQGKILPGDAFGVD